MEPCFQGQQIGASVAGCPGRVGHLANLIGILLPKSVDMLMLARLQVVLVSAACAQQAPERIPPGPGSDNVHCFTCLPQIVADETLILGRLIRLQRRRDRFLWLCGPHEEIWLPFLHCLEEVQTLAIGRPPHVASGDHRSQVFIVKLTARGAMQKLSLSAWWQPETIQQHRTGTRVTKLWQALEHGSTSQDLHHTLAETQLPEAPFRRRLPRWGLTKVLCGLTGHLHCLLK
mmetsp:Transcript_62410/g.157732  ORF Transcript_62410/g.157732 Transcript_62410/m.157732 type:complete len:231 (+) Transcript_62410:931-1623(+)